MIRRFFDWVLSRGRWPELPDEDKQSIADQVAARTAWVQSHRHPPACNGGCQCPPEAS